MTTREKVETDEAESAARQETLFRHLSSALIELKEKPTELRGPFVVRELDLVNLVVAPVIRPAFKR